VTAPGSLQTLLRGLASRPDAAVAGARLLNNGFPELSWGYPINPWGELRQMLTAALYYGRVRSIVHKIAKLSVVSRDVAWVSGACMAVKREDLDAVGLFDERYFMYREDVDLCVAMRKRGREVLFIAPAEVQHARGKSGSKNPDLERLRGRSHLAYYRKHLPAWAPLLKVYLKLRGRL
jgi:GT2 family glycosyltransferase